MADSRWRSSAVNSSAVARFSRRSSRGADVAQPAMSTQNTRRCQKLGERPVSDLSQHHIQRLPDFADSYQVHALDGFKFREIPLGQETTLEAHLRGFTDTQFSLGDAPHFPSKPHFSQHEQTRFYRHFA